MVELLVAEVIVVEVLVGICAVLVTGLLGEIELGVGVRRMCWRYDEDVAGMWQRY